MNHLRTPIKKANERPEITLEDILEGLQVYWERDSCHEVRIVREAAPAMFRRFDTPEAAADYVYSQAKKNCPSENFYLTMNPVDKRVNIPQAVCDKHICRRRRIVLDIDRDPVLQKVDGQKVSASDAELDRLSALAENIRLSLEKDFQWPTPVIVHSGNGYHLVYAIDLPADPESKRLVSSVLRAANARFRVPGVAGIDEGIFNASRTIKIPGTFARKGKNTADRPHRKAEIIFQPHTMPFLSVEQLGRLSDAVQPIEKQTAAGSDDLYSRAARNRIRGSGWSQIEFTQFLDSIGLRYRSPVPFDDGYKFVLETCPFGPHRKVTACLFWFPDGRVGFDCKESPSCDHKSWRDFYAVYAANQHQRSQSESQINERKEKESELEERSGGSSKIPRSKQYNFLLKRARILTRAELSVDEMEHLLSQVNASQCETPYSESKIREIAERASTWKPKQAGFVPPDDRPVIMTSSRQLCEIAEQAFNAIQKANDPPALFARAQQVVQIVQTREERNLIYPLDEDAMRSFLSHSAFYLRRTEAGHERGTSPPLDVVRELLSRGRQVKLDLPTLNGIVEAPTPLADGRILARHGYDQKSGLHCIPGNVDLSDLPERFDGQDARDAREYLENELLFDFPFEDDSNASLAHALAAVMTVAIRHAIPGLVPLALIDGTSPGSGKGLLVNVAAIIATGSGAHLLGLPADDEETRKVITSALASNSSPMLVFDNVSGTIKSGALERALTSHIWSDRILGENRSVSVRQRATWFMTANNVSLAGDLPRRTFRIRLNPRRSDPHRRSGFRHADLEDWTASHRATLLRAILTMWRAWWCAGRPEPAMSPLGSFVSWANTIGGILQHSGCSGFLTHSSVASDSFDAEADEMAAFLGELKRSFPQGFTVPELVRHLQRSSPPDRLHSLMPEIVARYVEERKNSISGLGKVFGFRLERRFAVPTNQSETGKVEELWLSRDSEERPIRWVVRSEVLRS